MVDKEKFVRLTIDKNGKEVIYYCFSKCVKVSKLGKVKLVISYENDFESEPFFICSNNLTWDARKIISVYSLRWAIDTFYRDGKQNLGMEDCEIRNLKGIQKHWYLMFLASSLLQLTSVNTTLNQWLKANILPVSSKRSSLEFEVIRSFISWVLKCIRNGLSSVDILSASFSSAKQLKLISNSKGFDIAEKICYNMT